MDPLALILTAISSGAASASQEIANDAIKNAYTSLKTLIQRKFADTPKAELALSEYENDPIIWVAPLKKALSEMQLDQDANIIKAAEKVITIIQSQQSVMEENNVQITGNVQGFVQGNYNTITQTFSDISKEK